MKKEWIMTEEARMQKRARIEENRRKRVSNPSTKPGSVESMADDQMSPEFDLGSQPSKKKQTVSVEVQPQQLQPPQQLTNVGFSPRTCQTPPGFGVGGSFSPPDSNASSKTSISPMSQQRKPFAMHDGMAAQ